MFCQDISLESELEKITLREGNYLILWGKHVGIFTKLIPVFNFYSPVPQESVATIATKGLTLPILILK